MVPEGGGTPSPPQRRVRARPSRGGRTNRNSSATGGSAIPGPPADAQLTGSSVQSSLIANPIQAARAPRRAHPRQTTSVQGRDVAALIAAVRVP
ncbi:MULTISPECIES: hypothetical protein [unclassified Streptomyces]|uniref:hypothetical protein n=1 Tax=unclassified Streptomyces TaxID=2593676 RepID=UPI002B1CD230|nr:MULTISPECIES: hypothetical protein [unclassified Streptomyces]